MPAKKKTGIRDQGLGGSKKANPQTPTTNPVIINGIINGSRTPSRILEEQVQQAVEEGARQLRVIADGQHGIGGRIWPRGETIKITVEGTSGQRLGSMGMPGTEVIAYGNASDDVGWLNWGGKN